MHARRARDVASSLIEAAQGAPDVGAWQDAALDALAPLGFDVAFLETKSPTSTLRARGFDAARWRTRWAAYAEELVPVFDVAVRHGIALDTEVLGARRERLAYFQEVVRPLGGTSSLFVHLAAGGRALGGLLLGRCGGAFGARDRAAVRAVVPALSVGLAAVSTTRAPAAAIPTAIPASVTPREREVLQLVRLGYTNPEIARALGTSPNTVRNQLVSLFAKVGATTRAELAGLAALLA